MPGFRQRWQSDTIRNLVDERRVLLLNGPRQCGKTTLSKHLDLGSAEYRTLDDATLCEAAEADPQSFVTHDRDILIIDEVQRVPSLLPAIKKTVDENNRPAQFLLAGSANVQGLPNVRESLAGRVANVRLRPFSEGEIRGGKPEFLQNAFAGRFDHQWAVHDRDKVMACAFRGGFPEVIGLGSRARRRWHRDYVIPDQKSNHRYDRVCISQYRGSSYRSLPTYRMRMRIIRKSLFLVGLV